MKSRASSTVLVSEAPSERRTGFTLGMGTERLGASNPAARSRASTPSRGSLPTAREAVLNRVLIGRDRREPHGAGRPRPRRRRALGEKSPDRVVRGETHRALVGLRCLLTPDLRQDVGAGSPVRLVVGEAIIVSDLIQRRERRP